MKQEPVLNVMQVMRQLPHRMPFLFVDKIISIEKGTSASSRVGQKAVGIKNVTINEPFFAGHFPERAIMPGVLLVEAMAQVGGIAYSRPNDPKMDVVIASIRSAKFREPVVPGDQVVITAEIARDGGQLLIVRAKAEVDQRVVAEAELVAKITFPQTV